MVVENRPGAGGNLAAEVVAKSPPDGNTWLLGNNSILATNQALYSHLGYDPQKDFAPVALVAIQPNILVVHPSVPAQSVRELIAYAKAHPGQLNYASTGAGVAAHLSAELFKAMAGVDLVHIPHKGSDQARAAILGGQVQMMFDAVPTMAANAAAGKVKALATSGAKRSPVNPSSSEMASKVLTSVSSD